MERCEYERERERRGTVNSLIWYLIPSTALSLCEENPLIYYERNASGLSSIHDSYTRVDALTDNDLPYVFISKNEGQ